MQKSRVFPSKILLFGEHTVLYGGQALAIPETKYFGTWQSSGIYPEDVSLFDYFKFIFSINTQDQLHNKLDIKRINNDLDLGVIFQSNIPIGYGVGSSGAFCAALYDRYKQNENNLSKEKIHHDLIVLESYFHGQSSGLDPLVSYFSHNYLVQNSIINQVEISDLVKDRVTLFDTKVARFGKDYIELFSKKMMNEDFRLKINEYLIPLNSKLIQLAINDDIEGINKLIFELSYFQLVWLNEFIPKSYITFWEQKLKEGKEIPKLCGAGGGGFLILWLSK